MNVVPDEYQKRVINSTSKDILVLAGAGSGKTFTLLSRIHKLVTYRKIEPETVLVLTFTRVAAETMRERYRKLQDSKYDRVPDFCTFHSFCYKMLSEYPMIRKKLGYESLPQVADEAQMSRIMLQAKDTSSCKLPNSVLSNPKGLKGSRKLAYENYSKCLSKLLRKLNVIDYNTLSNGVCSLVCDDDDVKETLASRYKYVFVDEFQDTDNDQFQFVMSMDQSERVLCGDALQNIYQFRGCTNKPLKQLSESSDWSKYVLPVNYRSSRRICLYVNSMSETFKSARYRIELKSYLEGPSVRECKCSDEEAYDVAAEYVKSVEDQGSVAVLFRTNVEVDECISAFRARGLEPRSSYGQEYKANVIKSVQSNEYKWNWVESLMNDTQYLAYRRLRVMQLKPEDIISSDQSGEFFSSIQPALDDVERVKTILKDMGVKEGSFALCAMFEVEQCPDSVEYEEELLQYLLNKVQSDAKDSFHIGTIHSVKGLEFDSVAVMGVGSKAFKIDNEERENLLYTACTRAKRNLLVFRS